MSLEEQKTCEQIDVNSLYAALARTATRGIALYFSRPVRLFRPAKVSGWHSIKGLAAADGVTTLTPQYFSNLVKGKGFMVIPKHFVPPILINAGLGTVLWASYTESSSWLEPYFGQHPTTIAALSGAIAGASQALVAAPAENVRLVLEGGSGHGWSHAWKEVFRGTVSLPNATKIQEVEEVRQVRSWMKEVGEMAGRGWDGWRWGVVKDIFGFAAFFAVFDCTRRIASEAKITAREYCNQSPGSGRQSLPTKYLPAVVHGGILVSGGVFAGLSYELASRPFDVARRTVTLARLETANKHPSIFQPILHKLENDGISSFFKDPSQHGGAASSNRRTIYHVLRTLARVGPWGVGFLAWEVFGGSFAQ